MDKYLERLNDVAKVLGISITPIILHYRQILRKKEKHHGRKFMIQYAKKLLTIGERYALHQPIEPLDFAKSNKEGLPKVLYPLKGMLRGNEQQRMLGLSILRYVEVLRLPISKDLSTVVDPCSSNMDVPTDFFDFIERWPKSIGLKLTLPSMEYHFTTRNGPNGPALLSSDLDIGSVITEPRMFRAIQTVSKTLNDEFPLDEDFHSQSGGIHSKLTQFPEKAGKTRTIAIVDYYSQRALKPLHRGLMKILRSLVSDGTYAHNKVGEYAKQCTEDKTFIYCADLTAATDRLPVSVQRALLNGFGMEEDLTAAFWTLLTERQFTVAWSGELVTYNTGQPMGCYGSWPLFALAHHAIVEYCLKDSMNPKEKYRIIGDDVIITDELAAVKYQRIMTSLGMTINEGKTVTSLRSSLYSSAEVAKQLFLNGMVLTPLTPGLIKTLWNPMLINSTLRVLIDRYTSESFPPLPIIKMIYESRKSYDRVLVLCSNPITGILPWEDHPEWRLHALSAVIERFRFVRIRALANKAMKIYQDGMPYGTYLTSWAALGAGYLDVQAFTGTAWSTATIVPEALVLSRREILIKLFRAIKALEEASFDDDTSSELLEIEYIPDPEDPFKDPKDHRNARMSSLIEETLLSLQTSQSESILDIDIPPYLDM